jgi:hypothetical protein
MGNEAVRVARNTFYASVGFGVLAFQKVQVRRRELEKALTPTAETVQRRLRHLTGHDTPAPESRSRPAPTTAPTPVDRDGATPAA